MKTVQNFKYLKELKIIKFRTLKELEIEMIEVRKQYGDSAQCRNAVILNKIFKVFLFPARSLIVKKNYDANVKDTID